MTVSIRRRFLASLEVVSFYLVLHGVYRSATARLWPACASLFSDEAGRRCTGVPRFAAYWTAAVTE
jgi:hypothetical protein